MNMHKLLLGIAALCASSVTLFAAAGPAEARDVTVRATVPDELPQAVVNVADLRLASAAGQRSLHRRVSSAVVRVCAPAYVGPMSLDYSHCVRTAWEGARPQMARVTEAQRLAQVSGANIASAALTVTVGAGR